MCVCVFGHVCACVLRTCAFAARIRARKIPAAVRDIYLTADGATERDSTWIPPSPPLPLGSWSGGSLGWFGFTVNTMLHDAGMPMFYTGKRVRKSALNTSFRSLLGNSSESMLVRIE